MAVSLAKVADVDRNIGNEDVAIEGFQEAIKLLDSLSLKSEEVGLEQRVRFLMVVLIRMISLDLEKLVDTLVYSCSVFQCWNSSRTNLLRNNLIQLPENRVFEDKEIKQK